MNHVNPKPFHIELQDDHGYPIVSDDIHAKNREEAVETLLAWRKEFLSSFHPRDYDYSKVRVSCIHNWTGETIYAGDGEE